MTLRRTALAAATFLAITAGARAEDAPPTLPAPILPGIGAHDPRVRIDPNTPPWRAVGKLQANAGNLHMSCTGTLVGPKTVLTAAHCVFNLRTGHNFPPGTIHFLIGFDGGNYTGHALVTGMKVAPGYDPAEAQKTRGNDWAVLTLDTPLGTPDRVLPLSDHAPEIGATIMIGGYSQDHALALTVDTECRIVGRVSDAGGHPLFRHNCTGTHGVSGAPVLIKEGATWRVTAIDVAAESGVASGVAVPLDDARSLF